MRTLYRSLSAGLCSLLVCFHHASSIALRILRYCSHALVTLRERQHFCTRSWVSRRHYCALRSRSNALKSMAHIHFWLPSTSTSTPASHRVDGGSTSQLRATHTAEPSLNVRQSDLRHTHTPCEVKRNTLRDRSARLRCKDTSSRRIAHTQFKTHHTCYYPSTLRARCYPLCPPEHTLQAPS